MDFNVPNDHSMISKKSNKKVDNYQDLVRELKKKKKIQQQKQTMDQEGDNETK